MSGTPAPEGARAAAADVAALREQQPLDLLMRTFTARVNSVIAEPPRAIGTPRQIREDGPGGARLPRGDSAASAAVPTPTVAVPPLTPAPAVSAGARRQKHSKIRPLSRSGSVNAGSSPTVAMLDERGMTVAPDSNSPVFLQGSRGSGSGQHYDLEERRSKDATSRSTRHSPELTLRNKFAERKHVVHKALLEPFGKESGILPLQGTGRAAAARQGVSSGVAHVAVSTAPNTAAASSEGREKALQRRPGVIQAAGGIALLCIMPAAVFVAVLAILYSTTPSFVRRKPREEIEVASLDHARVVGIAGASALLTALISVVWGTVVSRRWTAAKARHLK